tara:strand:- start:74 stop:868 length:795 start_codon:yes stop_codon:yes gene_type:complete
MLQEPQKSRNYIIYILFIFLSGSLFAVDLFSNKKFSNILSENIDYLFPVNQEGTVLFSLIDIDIFKTRNELINENARLKNEVIELRKLKITNEKLLDEIESNKQLIKNVQLDNFIYYKSSILIVNNEDKFLISGGRNLNLNKNDLVLNEEGFVIGFIVKIFDDHSLISSIRNKDFSIPGLDENGNQYIITSNKNELIVNSISIKLLNSTVDYIFTDLIFDHPGKFPILTLSSAEVSTSNNKIKANVDIEYNFNFNSDIYIVKTK